MISSGFVPPDTTVEDVAKLVAGAVGTLPGLSALVGVLPGRPAGELRARYRGAAWQEGDDPNSTSRVVVLLVGSRGREGDVEGLITEVHRAVSRAWEERWGGGTAALPLEVERWLRVRAGVELWEPVGDREMLLFLRQGLN
jgi:hypothetical protein